jgi:hypothetical protein
MANPLFEVECPCCRAVLKVDPKTKAVISHKQPERPAIVEDLAAAVTRLKGDATRREEAFQKSLAAERSHGDVLQQKFEELFRQAKENPDAPPPKRDIDFD